jgi:hypothetical protein
MSATVRVSRDRARSKDRRLPYAVSVDGAPLAELRRGETKDLAVSSGVHEVTVSVDFERSRAWRVTVGGGDVIAFRCRSGGSRYNGHLDLFLEDPGDTRAALVPGDSAGRDMAKRQRVVTRDGQVLNVWAHRSGYLRSLDPDTSGGGGDEFLVMLAYYVFVLPVLGVVRWARHRFLFRRGWSVGVVAERRFLWAKKVRHERFSSEADARTRAAALIVELESSICAPPMG